MLFTHTYIITSYYYDYIYVRTYLLILLKHFIYFLFQINPMFRHYVYYLTWSYHIIMIIFTHIYQPILHIHICRLLISTWSNFKEPIQLLRHRNSITIRWIHNTKNQPSVRQRPFLGRGGRGNLTIYRYKYRYLSRWGKRKPSWKRKKKTVAH